MLAYASVPLYRLFCQVTGFGGTTQKAVSAPEVVTNQRVTVTFNADIDKDLMWEFRPGVPKQNPLIGENILTYYVAENKSNEPLTGHATFNVVPHAAGQYFSKIECFCFKDQTLAPGQKVNMPISYYIDPAILDDPEMKNVTTITLSYTFFSAKNIQQ